MRRYLVCRPTLVDQRISYVMDNFCRLDATVLRSTMVYSYADCY